MEGKKEGRKEGRKEGIKEAWKARKPGRQGKRKKEKVGHVRRWTIMNWTTKVGHSNHASINE